MRRTILTLLAYALLGTWAYGQSCDVVLTSGLREYRIESSDSAYLNTLFDKHCQSDGRVNQSSMNIGLDAVVKAVPIKFTLGSSDSQQAVTNFCNEYSTSEQRTEITSDYEETIVARAYDSYDSCIRLSQQGFFVTHDLVTADMAQVLLRAGVGRPIQVTGVDTTENVSCVGNDKGQEVTFSVATTLESANTIGMFCTRSSRTNEAGSTVFDEGAVAINIAGDKYNFYWPRSEILAENVASRIEASIIELRATLNSQSSQLQAIGNGRVLGIGSFVSNVFSGSPGVSYDASQGVVTFPNPTGMMVMPLISDFARPSGFVTSTHIIDTLSSTTVKVRSKAMDTGDRTGLPEHFVVAIVGFQ